MPESAIRFEDELLSLQREVGANAAKRFLWQHKLDLLAVLHAAREMQRTSGGAEEGDAWLKLSAALRELDSRE